MDQQILGFIQGILHPGDKCIMFIDAGLVREWVKTSRILVLVEHSGEHGFFICISSKATITNSEDISIEKTIPVDDNFKCEIDTSGVDVLGADIYVKITYQKQKLLFELPYSQKANMFVDMISKVSEAYSLRMGPLPNFSWLQKYKIIDHNNSSNQFSNLNVDNGSLNNLETKSIKSGMGFEDNFSDMFITDDDSICDTSKEKDTDSIDSRTNDLSSPDNFGNLPRQSIALGATPLAARESVIRIQMAMREDDYTYLENFKIFIGTWNVNGQAPTISTTDWLSSDDDPPDFYAIGFQELDLSKEVFIFNDTPREQEWLSAVKNGLHPKAQYRKIKLIRLIGMMLIVFVKEQHIEHIHNISAETVGTGIMGKLGNKGGVAVRFDFHSTSICFVNCHLAAHVEEYERRNQDYNDICARMVFNQFKPPKFIKDHDHIYWFGDMNYRLMGLDTDQVKAFIDKECYSILQEHDQLTIQHGLKRVFVGYSEGPVKFLPTYKYDPGTNQWDSSEKSRPPAWCDRVLWKGEHMKQLCYRSHPSLLISDHKPVSAIFESGIKVVDNNKYRKIYEEVLKKLDKLENEFLPQVTVDKTEIHFEKVSFIEMQTQYLTIANTGQVPVQFEFIKKLNDTRFCKEWLTIKPFMSFIMTGEKCDIELEVYVDKHTASKLNTGQDRMYDILVLHLEGGKDIFITVTGSYTPSCFGSSLEALVRMHVPIRDIPVEVLINMETLTAPNNSMDLPFEIPKEIWLLVDHLYSKGMTQEDLFQQPGLHNEIQQIRENLDTGNWELNVSVHSVAEALLLFLEALAEPVIPYSSYHTCLECSNNFAQCKQVLSHIPKVHKNVFRYIIDFLKELLCYSSANKLDPKMLATIFSGVLLKQPPGEVPNNQSVYKKISHQLIERKKATFIYHFLMNDFDD